MNYGIIFDSCGVAQSLIKSFLFMFNPSGIKGKPVSVFST